MQFSLIALSVLALILNTTLCAQGQLLNSGAEAAGLGFATVAREGSTGVWANPAAIASSRDSRVFAGYENRYGIAEGLHSLQAAYLHPYKSSVFAITAYRFGDLLYSHHKLSLVAGQKLGKFSGGLRINQHQYSTEGANTRFVTSLDAGAIATIGDQLDIGMMLTNINQVRISKQTGERLASTLQIGFNYTPSKELSLLGEFYYAIGLEPIIKVGLEYEAVKRLSLRSGVNTGSTNALFFGIGLKHSVLVLDYAIETHTSLGFSQHVGLSYLIPDYAER